MFLPIYLLIFTAYNIVFLSEKSLFCMPPMRRELNFSHLATRCTTTSSTPLRRDSILLPKSISQLQTGDSTQQSRTLSENFEFSFFLSSFFFIECQAVRDSDFPWGVFPTVWGGRATGFQRGIYFFFRWDAKFSHSFRTMAESKQQRKSPGSGDRSSSHL